MTAEEHEVAIRQRLNGLKNPEWLLPIVSNIHNAMVKRIFADGISGSGAKIGNYSSNPMYASGKVFARAGAFQPQGKKSARPDFKNGKLRKTMYLQQGYRQLKKIQGLGIDFVNLTYSGSLQQDFITGLTTEDASITLRLNNIINQDKLNWLKKKYGDSLFQHTSQEKEQFTRDITKAITDCLTLSA